MTAARSVGDIVAESRAILGSIPQPSDYVCSICLGPKFAEYMHCYGCNQLVAEVPEPLLTACVPITSALSPSTWYSQLVQYKNTSRAPWALMASLLFLFLSTHRTRIQEMLGGDPTALTIVPSKRGKQFETHPLRKVLATLPRNTREAQIPVEELLRYNGTSAPRQRYSPEAFDKVSNVRGGRIIVVEDSFVSGATAVSVAGALLGNQASAVMVVPIARVVNSSFTDEVHPYRTLMQAPFEISNWPRPITRTSLPRIW